MTTIRAKSIVLLILVSLALLSGGALFAYSTLRLQNLAHQRESLALSRELIESIARETLQVRMTLDMNPDPAFDVANYSREIEIKLTTLRALYSRLLTGGDLTVGGRVIKVTPLSGNREELHELELLVNALVRTDARLMQSRPEERAAQVSLLTSIVSRLAAKNAAIARELIQVSDQRSLLLSAILAAQLGVSALLVILVGLLLISQVLKPIRSLQEHMHAVSEVDGDLTLTLPEGGNDELGAVARSFNHFSGKLRDVVAGLKTTMDEISRLSKDAAENSTSLSDLARAQASSQEEISSAVEEIFASAEQVTGTVNNQMQQVTWLVQKRRELSAIIEDTDRRVRQAMELVTKITQEARIGTESLDAMTGGMKSIERSSSKINSVAEIISDVADQTNLLSLNASIEAARAGDAGRGFAVVAQEISRLSDNTHGNIKEIDDLIKLNHVEIERGLVTVESAVERMGMIIDAVGAINTSTTGIAGDVSRQLLIDGEVGSAAQTLEVLSSDISAAVKEQQAGLREISLAVTSISEASMQAAKGADEVRSRVERVAELARNLAERAAFFKV